MVTLTAKGFIWTINTIGYKVAFWIWLCDAFATVTGERVLRTFTCSKRQRHLSTLSFQWTFICSTILSHSAYLNHCQSHRMTFHLPLNKENKKWSKWHYYWLFFFYIGIRHTKKDDATDLSVLWDNDRFPIQHGLKSSTKEVLNEVLRVPLDLRNPEDQTKSGHHIWVDIPERYHRLLIKYQNIYRHNSPPCFIELKHGM